MILLIINNLIVVSGSYLAASIIFIMLLLAFFQRKNYQLSFEEISDLLIDWGLKGVIILWIILPVFYIFRYEIGDVWSSSPFSIFAAAVALYVCTELFLFLFHFTCHKVSYLWAFHKKHHSIKVFSFTNSIVDSFVFQLVASSLFFLSAILLKVPILSLIVAYVFWRILLAFSHLDKPISYGVIGYILLDPKTHRRHHFDKNSTDYAVTLRLLDNIFKALL